MPQSWDMGQILLLPLRRKAWLRIFTAVKIERLRPGLNSQTWVPEASMLTTRPPKPSQIFDSWKSYFRHLQCCSTTVRNYHGHNPTEYNYENKMTTKIIKQPTATARRLLHDYQSLDTNFPRHFAGYLKFPHVISESSCTYSTTFSENLKGVLSNPMVA